MKKQNTIALQATAAAAEMKLLRCKTLFEECHDLLRLKEVYYLQAQLYSAMNRVKERDASSQCFVALTKHLASHSVLAESTKLRIEELEASRVN